jgi:tetratricopeptide (TPR) repeat protein
MLILPMYLRTLILITYMALWIGLNTWVALPVAAMPEQSGHNHSDHGHHGTHHSPRDPTIPAIFPFAPEAESWFNQGLDRLYVNDDDGAIAALTKSLRIAPDYRVYLKRGEVYAQMGAWTQAIADYTQALSMNEAEDAYVHRLRGMAWEAIGDFKAALADYTTTIQIYPSDGIGYTRRGAIYNQLGQSRLASRDFKAALKLNPYRAEAYVELGNLHLKLGNNVEAIKDYQTALALFKEQGKPTEAQSTFRQIEKLEIIPGD